MRLYLPGTECASVIVGYEPPATTTPLTDEGEAAEPEPPTTTEPVPILEPVTTATTIPPDVLDPYAGLPSVPLDAYVGPCE